MIDFSILAKRSLLLNSKVSIVENVGKSNKSYIGTFKDIINTAIYLDEVQEMKKMKGFKHSDKVEEYKKAKQLLPAFTLTTFGNYGESVAMFKKEVLNPYIIIDIDNIEVNETNTTKLNSLPFVLCTGISVSGEGYYSIVEIDDIVKTDKEFKELFKQLTEYYNNIGYEIDKSCNNLNRLRIISPYEIVWNDNYNRAFYYEIPEIEETKKEESINLDDYIVNINPYGRIVEPYKKGNMYNIRISWANTIYNVFGESGYNVYLDIMSEQPDKYKLNDYWQQAKKGGYSSNSYCIDRLKRNGYIKDKAETSITNILDDLF